MSKNKTLYKCTECSYQTAKWYGCCPQCATWNSFCQEKSSPLQPSQRAKQSKTVALTPLSDIATQSCTRMLSGIKEWDRVTGGGLMPGSFVMLTGDPGIGKSTLLLQIAQQLAEEKTVFYFSSEESLEQVKQRAERLGCMNSKLLFSDQANLDDIIETALAQKPDILIIDSIQNCYTYQAQSLPGSIGQLKESTFKLMRLAKEQTIAVLLSGHITKDGVMAGPKTLEHMVDAVFYLQGEDRWQTRILRSVKNRFGTVNEIGFFEMNEQGLQEVPNVNQYLLEGVSENPGSVLVSHIEGSRPLLFELQALIVPTKFGIPQRIATGLDQKQVSLIAAILEKYLAIKFSAHDIFFKISGGLKIKGNTSDLGIALTLLSSFFQQPLPEKSIALGEMSLTGQIKPINHINLHMSEIEKFGLKRVFVAKNQKVDTSLATKKFSTVYELLKLFE